MNDQIKSLYHDVIKQHQKNPYHFLKNEAAKLSLRANNPICGDRYDIFVDSDNNTLQTLHFHGFGCALSKASGSIMLEVLEGESFKEAENICRNFLDYIHNRLEGEVYSETFKAFEALHTQTARMDCAALTWKEMLVFLEKQNRDNDRHTSI